MSSMSSRSNVSGVGERGETRLEDGVVDWSDLGRDLWSFLNERRAEINYRFVDMTVEIPRDTGPEAPRAVWKVDGTLQVSTNDNASGN